MDEDNPNKWFYDYIKPGLIQLHGIKNILYSGRTRFQSVEIMDTASYGISLLLDGKIQSSQMDEFIYHEALVQPALVMHPKPLSVFIAGGGEGATLREALRHKSVQKALMIDIDAEVVDICRRFLKQWHQGAFEDRRTSLVSTDARAFLADSKDKFDVIIMDITDPLEGGPSYKLFTEEFYQIAKSRLNHQGIIVVQSGPGYWGNLDCLSAVANTMKSAFGSVYLYTASVPSFGGDWSFCLAGDGVNPLNISANEIDKRIKSRLKSPLKFYDGITHHGIFNPPKSTRDFLSNETRTIRDNEPLFIK